MAFDAVEYRPFCISNRHAITRARSKFNSFQTVRKNPFMLDTAKLLV